MKLSEAIRLGSMIRPQSFWPGMFKDGGSCVLGAVAEAIGLTNYDEKWERYEELRSLFPILDIQPPGQIKFLYQLLWYKNDTERISREELANWVEQNFEQEVKDEKEVCRA